MEEREGWYRTCLEGRYGVDVVDTEKKEGIPT